MGELAYGLGNRSEARIHFRKAAALWTDDLPDAASVEARAYVGLLDALEGQSAQGVMALRSSLEQAHKMGRLALEVRCRVHLARVYVSQRRFDEAISLLGEIPPDDDKRTLGPELRAQVHYWRSRVFAERGDRTGAQSEAALAQKVIQELQAWLPAHYRGRFALRPDIQRVFEHDTVRKLR